MLISETVAGPGTRYLWVAVRYRLQLGRYFKGFVLSETLHPLIVLKPD